MKTYYLALDLKDDPKLIEEYEEHHRKVWPEVKQQILESGITRCEIYRVHDRLMMVLDTTDDFTFEKKSALDAQNPKVQEWELLMLKYQQIMNGSTEGRKWQLMNRIFKLTN